MKITRTANAGVLIKLDGVRILIDGAAKSLEAYIGTPPYILSELYNSPPDIVAFTHKHPDHFDEEYASFCCNNSIYLAPDVSESAILNEVTVTGVKTGHIGDRNVSHISFVVEGSQKAFFMGDASPSFIKNMESFGKPDVLFVPFAYALTPSAWRNTKNTGAKTVVLLHLPEDEKDSNGICKEVLENTKGENILRILKIGETIEI